MHELIACLIHFERILARVPNRWARYPRLQLLYVLLILGCIFAIKTRRREGLLCASGIRVRILAVAPVLFAQGNPIDGRDSLSTRWETLLVGRRWHMILIRGAYVQVIGQIGWSLTDFKGRATLLNDVLLKNPLIAPIDLLRHELQLSLRSHATI